MPTVLLVEGFRFFFFSREETRMHVHVEYQGREAKIWLDTLEVAHNDGFKDFQLNEILKLTRIHEKTFKKAWIAYFG